MRNRTATLLIPIAATLLLLMPTGCDRSSQGTDDAAATPPPPGTEPAAAAPQGDPAPPVLETPVVPAVSLAERAESFWRARQDEDWQTVYDFQTERIREAYSVDEFREWSEQNEPILTQSYQLGETITEAELGWVEVDTMTGMRRFPDLPAGPVHRWDKWRVDGGAWAPVPIVELGNYPASPALRDAAEEARLLERFESVAWPARRDIDFKALYELMDPRNRPPQMGTVPQDEKDVLHKYLRFKVLWVEAVGKTGKVRVKYEIKKTDPALSKLPPVVKILTDNWVRVDGEWYLNVSGPSE